MTAVESLVIVEGADDRNFVKGLLLRLGCSERRSGDYPGGLEGGHWGFQAPDGGFVRVVDAKGKHGLAAQARLATRPAAIPCEHLVIIGDPDEQGDFEGVRTEWESRLRPTVERNLSSPVSDLRLLAWGDPHGTGPHDLEALVMAALSTVHPDREASITRWLTDSPLGRQTGKARAWSYFAKWQDEGSASFFYQSLWNDEHVAAALRAVLIDLDAWGALEALVLPDGAAR